jgi:hypothetical protein
LFKIPLNVLVDRGKYFGDSSIPRNELSITEKFCLIQWVGLNFRRNLFEIGEQMNV